MTAARTVALIPARGGSKRLPRKNALPFAGKPMLAWTIEAAREADLFDAVVFSTDDEEYADIAAAAGARILMRPARLADDRAGLIDVARHALEGALGGADLICLLLPNCPLRRADDIRGAREAMRAGRGDALLSVVPFGWTPPQRALHAGAEGLDFVFPDAKYQKSQAYAPLVCPSGAIYWARAAALGAADSLYVPGIRGYEMPWHRAIDIDERYDFDLALALKSAMDGGLLP